MKGGIFYPAQYSQGININQIKSTDWHVYLLSNQKDLKDKRLEDKFKRFPFCYIIRKKETIGKDPIYIIFMNNCSNDDIRQILQIAFKCYNITNVRINLTKGTSPIVSELKIDSEKSKVLLDKILGQYNTDTDTPDNIFKGLFIKIHGTAVGWGLKNYKFVSTGTLTKEQFSTMKISELKDIPTIDNELTEEERKQILSADHIIHRLEDVYRGHYVQKNVNETDWKDDFDRFNKNPTKTILPEDLRIKMYPPFQPYNSYFPCGLIFPLLGQNNDTIKNIHEFVISDDDDVKKKLGLYVKPPPTKQEIEEAERQKKMSESPSNNLVVYIIKKKYKFKEDETTEAFTFLYSPIFYIIRDKGQKGNDTIYLLFRCKFNTGHLITTIGAALGLKDGDEMPALINEKIQKEIEISQKEDENDQLRKMFIKISSSSDSTTSSSDSTTSSSDSTTSSSDSTTSSSDSTTSSSDSKYNLVSFGFLPHGNLDNDEYKISTYLLSRYIYKPSESYKPYYELNPSEQERIQGADDIIKRLRDLYSDSNLYEFTKVDIPVRKEQYGTNFITDILLDVTFIRDLDFNGMLSTNWLLLYCGTDKGRDNYFCTYNEPPNDSKFIHKYWNERDFRNPPMVHTGNCGVNPWTRDVECGR